MAVRRCLLELGTGVDLHGQDATKAARRAVFDALSPQQLSPSRASSGTSDQMRPGVTIATPYDRNGVGVPPPLSSGWGRRCGQEAGDVTGGVGVSTPPLSQRGVGSEGAARRLATLPGVWGCPPQPSLRVGSEGAARRLATLTGGVGVSPTTISSGGERRRGQEAGDINRGCGSVPHNHLFGWGAKARPGGWRH